MPAAGIDPRLGELRAAWLARCKKEARRERAPRRVDRGGIGESCRRGGFEQRARASVRRHRRDARGRDHTRCIDERRSAAAARAPRSHWSGRAAGRPRWRARGERLGRARHGASGGRAGGGVEGSVGKGASPPRAYARHRRTPRHQTHSQAADPARTEVGRPRRTPAGGGGPAARSPSGSRSRSATTSRPVARELVESLREPGQWDVDGSRRCALAPLELRPDVDAGGGLGATRAARPGPRAVTRSTRATRSGRALSACIPPSR